MEEFELEKFVMEFFGLSDEVTEKDKVDASFGQLVNLLAYFEAKKEFPNIKEMTQEDWIRKMKEFSEKRTLV